MPLFFQRYDGAALTCDALILPTTVGFRPVEPIGRAYYRTKGRFFMKWVQSHVTPLPDGAAYVALPMGHGAPRLILAPLSRKDLTGEVLAARYAALLAEAERGGYQSVAIPVFPPRSAARHDPTGRSLFLSTVQAHLQDSDLHVTLLLTPKAARYASREHRHGIDALLKGKKNLLERILRYCEVDDNDAYYDDEVDYYDDLDVTLKSEEATPESPTPVSPCEEISEQTPVEDTPRRSVFSRVRRLLEPPDDGDYYVDEDAFFAGLEAEITHDLEKKLKSLDAGFADTLFAFIDQKGMTDVACYRRANLDRKTFSKIRCHSHYRPTKNTALALAIALRLTAEETTRLLRTAGLSLSPSEPFDTIITYFIEHKIFDVDEINCALLHFGQPLLGSCN